MAGRFSKQATIISLGDNGKSETAKYRCGLCDSPDKVSFRCVQCQERLCLNCKKAHSRIQTTSDHQIHPLLDQEDESQKKQDKNEQKTQLQSEFCKKHPREEIKLYCNECEEAICPECITSLHNRHGLEKISVVFEKKKTKINRTILTLRGKYETEMNSILTNLHKQKDEYEEQTKDIDDKIRQREIKLIKGVNIATKSILSEFEKTWNLNRKMLEQYLAKTQKFASDIKEGISNHFEVTSKQSFLDVVRAEKELTELLKRVESFVIKDSPIFQTDSFFCEEDLDSQRIETLFGRHENESLYSSDFEECGNTSIFEVKKEARLNFNGPVVAICPQDAHVLFSIKVIDLQGPVYVFVRYNRKNETLETLYKLKPLIMDIAVLRNGDILATTPEDQKLYKLTSNGTLQVFLDTNPFHPYGISVSKYNGDILVVLNTVKSEGSINDQRGSVIRFSEGGKLKQTTEFSHDHQKLFMEPLKAIELPNQKLCVLDIGTQDAKFVNAGGVVETTYTGNSDRDVFSPNDIGCDRNGNVVIADGNDKIHLLSQNGQFIQYLMTEKVPQTVVFDEQDNLWIGCGNGKAFQISYKNND